VPILFLTALPEKALMASAPTGVHEILAKPFDVDDLLARVDRLTDGKHKGVAA
jgi:DNA-binding response OmpR family regulator